MKQTFFTLMLIASTVFSIAQDTKPYITITQIEDKIIDDSNNKITQEIAKNGFIIAIKDDIKISEFAVLNKTGNYSVFTPDKQSSKKGYATYILIDQYTGGNKNEMLIRLKQIKKEATITLKIEPSVNVRGQGKSEEECPECGESLFTVGNNCNGFNTNNNFFGESVDLYSENTVVYVYDFNKDPSKRAFYKITKNKESSNADPLLQIELESKIAIRDKAKTEFDKDKTNITNKEAFKKAQKDIDDTEASLENSKFGLKREIVNFNEETLTTGKNVRFKIYNVNKFIYNVSIADTVVEYDSEPPLLFSRFFLGDSTSLGSLMDAFTSEVMALSASEDEEKGNCFYKKLKCFIKEYNRLQSEILKAYNPCFVFECCIFVDYLKLANFLEEIRIEGLSSGDTTITKLLAILPKPEQIRGDIVVLNNMIQQNSMHTSDYISLNGNLLELTLNIESKDSIHKYASIPQYKNTINIQIPILWKPFVSFSSGSFIALGKHLQNKTYDWQETIGNNNTVTDSSYTLFESGYTLPPMGFCALGNLQWKLSSSFGLGGSFGVGLSIEKSPKLAYLGGVSLFFGDLRQLVITGGFAGMQVEKLTNNFTSIVDNQVIYTSKPDIQYYNEFKVGGFISLTYTPFKVYKTKTIKSKNK